MIYTELTKKAMNIAYKAHDGQFDKCGYPYIFHPIHVAESILTIDVAALRYVITPKNLTYEIEEYLICIALLHDVVEDSDITIEDLAKEFPEEVVHAVDLLTHKEGVDYFDYIYAINANYLAKVVKVQDILHNKNKDREALIIDEDQAKKDARDEKYRKALSILL